MTTRKELIEAAGARYRLSSMTARTSILDEFVAITGYHRKHPIRLLSKRPEPARKRNPTVRRYGPEVCDALGVLWEVSDHVRSKRLKVMIPTLLPALIRHGKLSDDPTLCEQLAAVSAATIDRLLAPLRQAASKGRRRAAGQSSAVRRAIPIRTFGDWDNPVPGNLEVDFVAHSGPQLAGSFIQTLVLTDVATGWTEYIPVLTRDSTLVIDAISKARELFPFPMLAVNFDNDSVFMNDRVVKWCREQGIAVTRARANRKNDQAWVEQEKWRHHQKAGRVRPIRGSGICSGADTAVPRGSAPHQRASAVVQAAQQDAHRRQSRQAIPSAPAACEPGSGT